MSSRAWMFGAPFAESDLDLEVGEVLNDGGDVHRQPIVIAHPSSTAVAIET
jgi:hypothetical protein